MINGLGHSQRTDTMVVHNAAHWYVCLSALTEQKLNMQKGPCDLLQQLLYGGAVYIFFCFSFFFLSSLVLILTQ